MIGDGLSDLRVPTAGSISVRDVLAMPALRTASPDVLVGGPLLDRRVRWAHSAELADIAPLLRPGDLLLTTGIAMPETADGLDAYAASLAESGVAALVVELGRRWPALPDALVDACRTHDLALVALGREVRFASIAQAVGERIVDEQVAGLREAQRVHDTFTELSISEAGPREILEAVQRLAGAVVVLEAEDHRLLDFRTGPGRGLELLDDWPATSRAIAESGRTAWDAESGWLVTRVGRRDRGWGRLLLQSPTEPAPGLVATAERAAAALALHRLHDRHRDSTVRRTHHEILTGLLADPDAPELHRRCELAGLPVHERQLVGVTLRPHAPSAAGGPAGGEAVVAAAVQAAHVTRTPALVCEMDGDVRVLLSLGPSTDARAVTDDLAAHVRRRRPVVVAAGRPVDRAGQVDRTLREAQQVMGALRDDAAADQVHRLEDVHLRGLLAMLGDDDRLRLFTSRELDPLLAHDAAEGSDLLGAVRALLLHPGSKSAAAAALHVSRPVFYDRLRRAESVLGIDLDDPDSRVSLHVALLARRLC